jgi:hypothetical protein
MDPNQFLDILFGKRNKLHRVDHSIALSEEYHGELELQKFENKLSMKIGNIFIKSLLQSHQKSKNYVSTAL